MWLNDKQTTDVTLKEYREFLLGTSPNHVVIDGLFNETKLDEVMNVLQQPQHWQTQQHTYAELYVGNAQWQMTNNAQRFVQRDVWQPDVVSTDMAQEFLLYLRGGEFMSVLSRVFNVPLTDINVAHPEINTKYFRLASNDFVKQHADDSPGRKVCMLLYLNKNWSEKAGGKLGFTGKKVGKEHRQPIAISPLYNRCVLFDPSSAGSEHWVETLNAEYADQYRYNITSWYWEK